MIPVGFMAKCVHALPKGPDSGNVIDFYSVSKHVSKNFTDFEDSGLHNKFWFMNSIEDIVNMASAESICLDDKCIFYYEMYEFEYVEDTSEWRRIIGTVGTSTIIAPNNNKLEGFDVVTYSIGNAPQCSPLSCNNLYNRINTNEHCLIADLSTAIMLLDSGAFNNSEDGPFRILGVYRANSP